MRPPAGRTLLAMTAVVLALTAGAGAQGLLACGASPDGSQAAVGGYNRAVSVYDTSDWRVARRVWIGASVRQISFGRDGERCLVLDEAGRVHLFDTDDWSPVKTIEGVRALAVARSADVAVTAGGPDDAEAVRLHVWSLPAGEHRAAVTPPRSARRTLSQVAVSPDGARAYARTTAFDNPDETDAAPSGSAQTFGEKQIRELRTDGKSSAILSFDLDGGAFVKEVVCFDHQTVSRFRRDPMFVTPHGVITAAYSGYLGVLDPDAGTYEPVIHTQLAYGAGLSRRGHLYIGSLRHFIVLSPEGEQITDDPVRLEKLPGWPEYFRSFAPLGDDRMLGVTSAYRLVIVDARRHEVARVVNCY